MLPRIPQHNTPPSRTQVRSSDAALSMPVASAPGRFRDVTLVYPTSGSAYRAGVGRATRAFEHPESSGRSRELLLGERPQGRSRLGNRLLHLRTSMPDTVVQANANTQAGRQRALLRSCARSLAAQQPDETLGACDLSRYVYSVFLSDAV
jgi:hypothetical protein